MNKTLVRIRDLIHHEEKPSFFHRIDLLNIEEGVLIGVTGTLGIGYRFEGRDILLSSQDGIADFEERMRRFLNHLPELVGFHFLVRSKAGDEEVLKEYAEGITSEGVLGQRIAQAKADGYRKTPLQKREVFLFLTLQPFGFKKGSSLLPDLFPAFSKKSRALNEVEFRTAKQVLLKIGDEIQSGFQDMGFNLERLRDLEILRYHFELLNPSDSQNHTPVDENYFTSHRDETLRSKLLLAPPFVDERFFYLDGYFHKGINLRLRPDETQLKSMRNFERALGKEYILSLSFHSVDQDKGKSGIKRQGNYAKAQEFFSKSRNADSTHQAEETTALLTEMAVSEDMLFSAMLGVLIKSRDRADAESRASDVLRAFPKFGDAHGLEDHMNHDRLFLSCLPLQGDENPLSFLFRAEALVHLLPLQASWKGTTKPGLLLRTWRDEALKLDVFDPSLPAKHGLMLGSTGSGKSFFTNHLLLHFLVESPEHEVIVMDIGGSYQKLCRILGGAYVELECTGEYVLNPFPVKKLLFPAQDADATFLQFLKELLQQMIAPDRVWAASEKMILERSIREVYRSLRPEECPILGDIEKLLLDYPFGDAEDKRKAYQFAKELSLFTLGEYGKLLNQRGGFDFDSRFTVFDLRKISDYLELQEILLLIIPFALKRRFENVRAKKLLVLDECWRFLKDAQGSDLIENFYRTARKMNAGVLSISQNPEDFLEARIAGVMINNSPVKYILRLKKGHEKLASFGLNENEIQAVSEIEVKPGHFAECFIKFDEHGVMVKLLPNSLEYWISTTDAMDLAEEKQIRVTGKFKSEIELMEHLALEFPNGVKKASLREAA